MFSRRWPNAFPVVRYNADRAVALCVLLLKDAAEAEKAAENFVISATQKSADGGGGAGETIEGRLQPLLASGGQLERTKGAPEVG